MRPLLAVIVLFAAQNSLFATLVYRYEFAYYADAEPRPQGSEGSGYIDFLTPTGNNVPVLDAVYDLQFRGFGAFDEDGVLPDIAAPIFSSLDGSTISGWDGTAGAFMDWDGAYLTGLWIISYLSRTEDGKFLSRTDISDFSIDSFYPLEYDGWNETSLSGNWIFTGARKVPESGRTSLYITISVVALAVFRWRHLNWSR